jgi:hypothetical protein
MLHSGTHEGLVGRVVEAVISAAAVMELAEEWHEEESWLTLFLHQR